VHNSQSQLTSHFGPLHTSKPSTDETAFTIVLFAQDGNRDLAAVVSLQNQTLTNWSLVVVNPPSGSTELGEDLRNRIGPDKLSTVEYSSAVQFVASRPSKYVAFLQQETLWHPNRLGHDHFVLESSSAAAVFSLPLICPEQVANSYVPSFPTPVNRVVRGALLLEGFSKVDANYFGLDVVTVRRQALANQFTCRNVSPSVAVLELLQSEDIYCSDKCLCQRTRRPLFEHSDLARVAQAILLARPITTNIARLSELPKSR